MHSVGLAELLGSRPTPIKWERVSLYAAAAVVSTTLWGLLNPIVQLGIPSGPVSVLWFEPLTPWQVVSTLLMSCLRALAIVAALRWIASLWTALLVGSAAYVVLRIPISTWIMAQVMGEGRPAGSPNIIGLLTTLCIVFVTLASLAVALRRIPRLLHALAAGLTLGAGFSILVAWIAGAAFSNREGADLGPRVLYLLAQFVIDAIAPALLLALLWYAGLRMTKTLDPGTHEGRLPAAIIGQFAAIGSMLVVAVGMHQVLALRGVLDGSDRLGYGGIASDAMQGLRLGSLVVSGLSGLLAIGTFAVLMMAVYRMWSVIRDDSVRTRPGQAAGFLLIPVFNFLWLVYVFAGFASSYNAAAERRGLAVRTLSPRFFFTLSIVALLGALGSFFLPFAGVVPWACMLAMLMRIADAVRAWEHAAAPAPG